jgi:hypothetical protein
MAFDPINYSQDVQTPFAAAAQGYQLGAGIRDDQQKQVQQAQAMRQQQIQQQTLQDLISNPSPTAQDYARATMIIPGMREQFDQAHKMMSADQQRADLSHVSQVYAALSQDKPEVATKLLSDRAEALRNSGRKDEAAHLDTISQLTTQAPALARSMAGLYLASVPGGDKVIEGAKGLGGEQRANDLQPGLVRQGTAAATSAEARAINAPRAEAAAADEAVSKATKAGAEANNAPAYYASQAAEAGSKATTASVAAEVASKTVADQVQQKVQEAKLTKAQTDLAIAHAKKLDQETQNALKNTLGGDPEKRFDAELKLRKEYETGTKGYTEVSDAYRRVKAAGNDGAGDIALIYGYMKMLDPGSVVREGEFATASNSAGIPATIQNLYNKALSGQRLTDGQRKTFLGQAGKLAEAAGKRESEVRSGLSTVARSYGLSSENIFGIAVKKDPADEWVDAGKGKPPAPAKTSGGVTVSGW